jgi:predicted nucleic acid-binding protein
MRVLFDTDVIVDALTARQPFHSASAQALATSTAVEAYVSGHAVTTLFYLIRKQLGSSDTRSALFDLLKTLRVAPVTDAVIRAALASSFNDFEDGVTHAAALEANVDIIVTRNTDDFKSSLIEIVRPEEYWQRIRTPPSP